MKNSYLLSGMIVLGSVASVNASPYEDIKQATMGNKVDWQKVYGILQSEGMFSGLTSRYYGPGDGVTLLGLAMKEQNIDAVRELLKKYGANPDASVSQRMIKVPLYVAAREYPNAAIVSLLLTAGATPVDYFEGVYPRPYIATLIDQAIEREAKKATQLKIAERHKAESMAKPPRPVNPAPDKKPAL